MTDTTSTTPAPLADSAWGNDTSPSAILDALGIDTTPVEQIPTSALRVEVAALRDMVHRLALDQAALIRRATALEQALATARRRLADFRDHVRAKAIELADVLGWSRQGLNEALSDLGLDPCPPPSGSVLSPPPGSLPFRPLR